MLRPLSVSFAVAGWLRVEGRLQLQPTSLSPLLRVVMNDQLLMPQSLLHAAEVLSLTHEDGGAVPPSEIPCRLDTNYV